jgi:hypothetical protein
VERGWLLIGLICCLSAVNLGIASTDWTGDPAVTHEEIICKDGERFGINERDTVETALQRRVDSDLIVVEKHYLRLTLYRDRKPLKVYTVAIGKPETPSPVGEWRIIHKGGKWGGGFGERWLGLNVPWGIYGIHGTNKPGSIGQMSSHGCIRMQNRQVRELYNLVQVGTPVHILGDLPRVTPRKVLKRNSSGEDVLLLQFALRKNGFECGPADGRFGVVVEQAVFEFQKFYGLPLTGRASLTEQYLTGLRRPCQ